jgi:hypothetical protein
MIVATAKSSSVGAVSGAFGVEGRDRKRLVRVQAGMVPNLSMIGVLPGRLKRDLDGGIGAIPVARGDSTELVEVKPRR